MTKPDVTPTFASEEEEREFWDIADSTNAIDWGLNEDADLPQLTQTPDQKAD